MQEYQKEFIVFLVEQGVLSFGDFTLKSGRHSPYFINMGAVDDGGALRRMGSFYASLILDRFPDTVNVLFGPAYKGIPLAAAAATALDADHHVSVKVSFDRKEAKGHGEKGKIFGHVPKDGDQVVIIDDVFTTGATKEEAVDLIRALGDVSVAGVAIAVDRMEAQEDGRSAVQIFEKRRGIPVGAVVTIRQILAYLTQNPVGGRIVIDENMESRVKAYLDDFGIKD